MTLNPDRMVDIAEALYVTAIAQHHGEDGVGALRRVLLSIRTLYKDVSPERISGTLAVVHPIMDIDSSDFPYVTEGDTPARGEGYSDVASVAEAYDSEARASVTVLEVDAAERYRLFTNISGFDPETASGRAIVYIWSGGAEMFVVNGAEIPVPNPSPATQSSAFAIPTFRKLEDAIEAYHSEFVRHSGCIILREVWEPDARLIFKNKPEAVMRRSLAQFLRVSLRSDAAVRQEQNVDETRPIDVEVTWQVGRRIAIIEIKWLGASRTSSRSIFQYREGRARTGAAQLADYLDRLASDLPRHERTGYLVIFDGRRRGIQENTESLSVAAALYFRDATIAYDPAYHELRDDFATPIRMFMEPALSKCTVDEVV